MPASDTPGNQPNHPKAAAPAFGARPEAESGGPRKPACAAA